jgi:hydrogenase expression/formation protein HypC
MCLAVPMKLIKKSEFSAIAEIGGVKREISLMLLPEAHIGDYVIVHAGFAIQKLNEEEANKRLELLRELAELDENRI